MTKYSKAIVLRPLQYLQDTDSDNVQDLQYIAAVEDPGDTLEIIAAKACNEAHKADWGLGLKRKDYTCLGVINSNGLYVPFLNRTFP